MRQDLFLQEQDMVNSWQMGRHPVKCGGIKLLCGVRTPRAMTTAIAAAVVLIVYNDFWDFQPRLSFSRGFLFLGAIYGRFDNWRGVY